MNARTQYNTKLGRVKIEWPCDNPSLDMKIEILNIVKTFEEEVFSKIDFNQPSNPPVTGLPKTKLE